MNFFKRVGDGLAGLAVRAAKVAGIPVGDPALAEFFAAGSNTASGAAVTVSSALTVTTVFACIRVLSESVAALPLNFYKRGSGGAREADPGHPLYQLLSVKPNRWQTPFEFRETQVIHLATWGNFYAYKVEGNDGQIKELIPLRPDRVRPFWVKPGVPAYKYRDPKRGEMVFLQHEIHHIRFYPADDMLTGRSPITLHRETIGHAMSAQEYGARFFANDATPGGVIEMPGVMNDAQVAEFRKYWEKRHRGVGHSHRPAVLEAGMAWKQVTLTPEDAQYIETRKFSVPEICRIYRVPPHMVADLEKATFSNIENQSLGFVVFTLTPWLVRIEQAAERDLFDDALRRTHFLEFLTAALLRGDLKSRYEAHKMGRDGGWLSANDIRRMENMNPIPDGDVYLVPLNMIPANKAGNKVVPTAVPPVPAGGG